jgi:hypothetical protein
VLNNHIAALNSIARMRAHINRLTNPSIVNWAKKFIPWASITQGDYNPNYIEKSRNQIRTLTGPGDPLGFCLKRDEKFDMTRWS